MRKEVYDRLWNKNCITIKERLLHADVFSWFYWKPNSYLVLKIKWKEK